MITVVTQENSLNTLNLCYAEIYMFGMMCSLIAASLWVTIATYLELGVSTTHSISAWLRILLTHGCGMI